MKSDPRYQIILSWSEEDEAFVAEVPELPGCAADGPSYEEALTNVQQVMAEWTATAEELGRAVPVPREVLLGRPVEDPKAVLLAMPEVGEDEDFTRPQELPRSAGLDTGEDGAAVQKHLPGERSRRR